MSGKTERQGAQRRASDPRNSAWVDASAGTGKTTVLTDRVLRLLLDGAPPERILCITFTRAAAAEMANRIIARLGDWVAADDAALDAALFDLTGARPTGQTRRLARQLFARVVDAPAGFRIQTIHAFCQSVLRRFPLEAGLAPQFELVEDRTRDEMLGEAQRALLIEAGMRPNTPLGHALAVLVEHMSDDGFAGLVQTILSARRELSETLAGHGGVELLTLAMWRGLGLERGVREAEIIATACRDDAVDCDALRNACALLAKGSATDQRRAENILAWLSSTARARDWENYVAQFLGKNGEINRSFIRTKAHQAAAHWLDPEAERLLEVCDRLRAAATARATEALLAVADALLKRYDAAKAARAVLDYDDLIDKTLALLETPGAAAWVLYKLDGGIDHILLDEAQDTNPRQWRIVQALAEEFFAGEGARTGTRTLFVVGDEKQSIYSFQGSDPSALGRLHAHFAERIGNAGKKLEPVDLTISYRSTQPVLSLVDSVFASAEARDGLLNDPAADISHAVNRIGHAGLVELWPTFTPVLADDAAESWPLPLQSAQIDDPEARLAARIADTVQNWIATKEMLTALGRPIGPGDIMILVRRRTRFVGPMVRALKARGVPVAGVDRLSLTESLAVQDLMALGRFLLLPEDDLNLAALLKSPLLGIDDDQLFALAYRRSGSLWSSLIARTESDSAFEPARAWLAGLLGLADYLRPFELFARVLTTPCPADPAPGSGRRALHRRLGPDALDPLDEFLSAALEYERRHAPTLEGFVGWLDTSAAEVKRELTTRTDAVRIVTVHGAKGLEAPIVFLPDTMQTPHGENGPQLLWQEEEGQEEEDRKIPYWVPRAELRPRLGKTLAEAARTEIEQEYRRLLYVALTRARDRLYVAGWRGKKDTGDGHWYAMIEAGMRAAGAVEIAHEHGALLRLEQPQTADVASAPPVGAATQIALPDWTKRPAPAEPRPTRPLTPSRLEPPDGIEPAAHSPASPEQARRFRRGRAIHRLLQILPDIAPADRETAAKQILSEWPDGERAILFAQAQAVLDDPACAAFFGPASRAEVPVVGRIGARGVAGQIDRLLVEPEHVTIVDFKTGRAPGAGDRQPSAYLAQMAAYRAVLRQIYPGRSIRAVLLWTEIPAAIVLESEWLDPYEAYLVSVPVA